MSPVPELLDLGRAPFGAAHHCMLRVAEAIRKTEAPGNILLVEHEPVYTAGRATPPSEVFAGVIPVERGGKITYHGPGQLVVYPVVRLPSHDVRAWLRALEDFGVAVCSEFGLEAAPSAAGTGVFVNGQKLISIGVAIRHWINLHGISINVDMELGAFRAIRPCGLDPAVMSDLSRAVGRRVLLSEVKAAVAANVEVLLRDHGPARVVSRRG